jgi:tetratricopeptide (TPR) repeat protein
MFESIRKGLIESYKHKIIPRVQCVVCGRKDAPLSLHVIEYYHSETMRTPSSLVAMSQSRGAIRGGVPICDTCCPPCEKCALPIATPWIKKIITELSKHFGGISFVVGNGCCQHIHVLRDFKSIFKAGKIIAKDEVIKTHKNKVDSRRDRAIELMQKNSFGPALKYLEELLENDDSDGGLLYMAGQCARFINDYPLAISYLSRAAAINSREPKIFLALGIAYQLSDRLSDSESSLRAALKLDADMESAYNSLGLTQSLMGEISLSIHNYEEGLNALSRRIARSMKNQRATNVLPHPKIKGTRWTQLAINGGLYLCSRESGISRFAWPTGSEAISEAKSRTHEGLFWVDSINESGEKTRKFLPNYFNTFCAELRREQVYINIMQNLGKSLETSGKQEEARACFSEAAEFLD